MRLFGIAIEGQRAKAYFTDAGYITMMIVFFDAKEIDGRVYVSIRSGEGANSCTRKLKFARTKYTNNDMTPVEPLYSFLVSKGLIFPFQSQMENEEWQLLPFEAMTDDMDTWC